MLSQTPPGLFNLNLLFPPLTPDRLSRQKGAAMLADAQKITLPDQPMTLLTGATGALGQELLYQLLENRPTDHFVLLSRGSSKKQPDGAARRINKILQKHLSPSEVEKAWQRLSVLDGDINEPQLGLSDELYRQTAERLDQVLHCAAAVRFDQPLAEARETNLEGTRKMLELARLARHYGRNTRFDYIGTSYIAGKRSGVIYESELDHKRGFHNTYEQSKYETEQMLRTQQDELPIAIYRPSIIIGNSRTGETSNFKAFYWPLRVYAMGQMRLLPGVADCQVDLVPVDFVAGSVVALSGRSDTPGHCYHLTAGRDNLISLRQIMDAAIGFFGIKSPALIHPAFLKLAEGWPGRYFLTERTLKTLRLGEPYYPYFALKLQFDTTEASRALQPTQLKPPSPQLFFDRLFRYCVETDWGRKQETPVRVAAALPPEENNLMRNEFGPSIASAI